MAVSGRSTSLRRHLAAAALLVLAIGEPAVALSTPSRPLTSQTSKPRLSKPVPIPGFRSLVVSQCFSSWGDRCWDFAAPFFLLTLQPNSLGPIAAQGLVVGVSTVLAAPAIGKFVDSAPRLRAARGALLVQNSLVAACALIAAFVLPGSGATGIMASVRLRWAAAVAFSLGCAGASCASLANSLSVSKDWVVVLASTSSEGDAALSEKARQERLAVANASLRKVDLVAKVFAPAAIGMLLAVTSQRVAALLLASWNVCSAVLEATLLTAVHRTNRPALLAAKVGAPSKEAETKSRPRAAYGVQRAARAGLALSLLYLSALTFGALMSAFLHTQGMSIATIGRGRAAAGVTSLLGAAAFPAVRRRFGTGGAGRAGVLLQLTALTPAIASLCMGGGGRGVVSLMPLACGVIVSRAGLWLFDLSVSQIFQETVEPADRGAVGAALEARHACAQGLSYLTAVALPRPDQFGVHIVASFAATALAAAVFESYLRNERLRPADGPASVSVTQEV